MLQFETARNVYLYAWFVYRFYPVSEHQCLACLELALRERLKEEIRLGKIKEKRPTLHPLLKYAVEHGLVRNEGFSAWQNRGEIRSRARVEMEKLREASEKNLTEITWDESDIQITAEDLNWDYVKMLPELLPMTPSQCRNVKRPFVKLASSTPIPLSPQLAKVEVLARNWSSCSKYSS